MNFKYLVIEGPIGVGKTTLAKRLAEEFQGRAVLDSRGKIPTSPPSMMDSRAPRSRPSSFFWPSDGR